MGRPASFRLHILPLFRDLDVQHMRPYLDLTDYEDVKVNADEILKRLKSKTRPMPPVADDGPWPEEWIALFERWIEEGKPE